MDRSDHPADPRDGLPPAVWITAGAIVMLGGIVLAAVVVFG